MGGAGSMGISTDPVGPSARSLFESGINWGRVVALLGFGYRLALYLYYRGRTGFLGLVTRFVAKFILQNSIARWIAQRGGWVSAGRGGRPPWPDPHPSSSCFPDPASLPCRSLPWTWATAPSSPCSSCCPWSYSASLWYEDSSSPDHSPHLRGPWGRFFAETPPPPGLQPSSPHTLQGSLPQDYRSFSEWAFELGVPCPGCRVPQHCMVLMCPILSEKGCSLRSQFSGTPLSPVCWRRVSGGERRGITSSPRLSF